MVERVHGMLDEQLVDLSEKILDALIISGIVHHDKTCLASSHKGRYKPLIKLVNRLQVHIVGLPFMFIDQVKGSMCDELI